MFDFGDEITIQNYRIPWLIWIQILIIFLLILILCFFSSSSGGSSLFALDISAASDSTSASFESHLDKMPVFNHTSKLLSSRFQVGEEPSLKGEISPGTSKGILKQQKRM